MDHNMEHDRKQDPEFETTHSTDSDRFCDPEQDPGNRPEEDLRQGNGNSSQNPNRNQVQCPNPDPAQSPRPVTESPDSRPETSPDEEIEFVAVSVICERCQGEIRPDAKFCPICGHRIGRHFSIICSRCRSEIRIGANFCTRCGLQVGAKPDTQDKPVTVPPQFFRQINRDISLIKNVILLFAILVITNVAGMLFFRETGVTIGFILGLEIFDSLLVIAWFVIFHRNIAGVFYNWDCGILKYAVAAVAAVPIYTAVHFTVYFFTQVFGLAPVSFTSIYYEAGYGYMAVILSMCLQPAIIEEMAFRGIIQTTLLRFMGWKEAIIATSAAFAILHFSPLSFVHLFLLGAYLGWLRHWAKSLYPSMIAHFLHNLLVVVQEAYHILPE